MTPVFSIAGRRVMLDLLQIATVPVRGLSRPVTNLAADRDAIIAALDMLFTGI